MSPKVQNRLSLVTGITTFPAVALLIIAVRLPKPLTVAGIAAGFVCSLTASTQRMFSRIAFGALAASLGGASLAIILEVLSLSRGSATTWPTLVVLLVELPLTVATQMFYGLCGAIPGSLVRFAANRANSANLF